MFEGCYIAYELLILFHVAKQHIGALTLDNRIKPIWCHVSLRAFFVELYHTIHGANWVEILGERNGSELYSAMMLMMIPNCIVRSWSS
jgi:hypothetical protein